MTPGFAVTDYKVQGATFQTAVLDLRRGSKSDGMVLHKRFCSTYVQLSCLQSLQGVHLLEKIELEDINNKPHPRLEEAANKLDELSDSTLSCWTASFNARRPIAIQTPTATVFGGL